MQMHSWMPKGAAHVVLAAVLIACSRDAVCEDPPPRAGTIATAAGSIGNPAPDPDEGTWVRAAKDYASWRYSTLAEVTTDNVAQLKPAWTFSRRQDALAALAMFGDYGDLPILLEHGVLDVIERRHTLKLARRLEHVRLIDAFSL